jgi:pentatricopeptide repeat protein
VSKNDEEGSAKEAWELFQKHYVIPGKEGDALRRPSASDRTIIRDRKLFKELLRVMGAQWVPGDGTLPAPGDVAQTLHELGVMGQGWYLREILEILYRALRLTANSTQEVDAEAKIILEEQLLLLWSQFFRNCPSQWIAGMQPKTDGRSEEATGKINWNGLPDVERINFSKKIGADAYRFPFRLHRMFSGVPVASTQHLAAAALLSFDYFTHQYCHAYATPNDRVPYEPFLRLVLRTLHGSQDSEITASLSVSLLQTHEVPQEEIANIEKRLRHIQHRSALAIAIDELQVLGSGNVTLSEEQDAKLIGYFHGRIKRQIERQNRGVVDQLWQQAQLAYGYTDLNSAERSANLIPPKIYSAFLFGYRDLGDPERQTEIWNHMLASGMTPTHEQWGLMMSARMKHLNAMEHIWDRMIESGTPPDHQTWCTRLSGHIYYGDPEEGIQMLYEWSNQWYNEIKKLFNDQNVTIPEMSRLNRDGPNTPRPNTDTLTTVITALVQRKGGKKRRLDLVPDAFAWAQSFAVKPNLWTYNILFRTCLKDGNLKEAMQILSKMEEDSITPDAYTFYGFADFVFKQANKSAMSQEEQYKLMFSILNMLQQRGLEPGKVFFGSMIDGLLKRGSGGEPNINAAMMLLRIMTDKQVPVSSQIWTSLMTHYFQEGRKSDGPGVPDWNNIEALWRRINEQPVGLDAMFYDRMIAGFSEFGEIGRATTMLERMSKEGKRPGWSSLTALLEAHLSQNQHDQAKTLVQDVATGTGLLKDGVRSANDTLRNPARERFFAVAQEASLVDGMDVDCRAVKEYDASQLSGMDMPMGVGEGYTGYENRSRLKNMGNDWEEQSEHGKAENAFLSVDEIENAFRGSRDVMPGWDEVVERPSARSGRR